MNTVVIKAYAKINLFLEVCDKRPDSYHNIDSIMQSVSLCDIVTLEKSDEIILSNSAGLPNDENNLAYKAAKSFFDYTQIKSGVKIHIEKHIPISAGLAGGSADAAAVLKGLNELYETEVGIDTLCNLGSKLGADVPFCIRCGSYITKGIGDIFTPCPTLPNCYIVISKAGEGVSTPFAYREIDSLKENGNIQTKTSERMVDALSLGNIKKISEELYNVFEIVVCPIREKVNEQKNILKQCEAIGTLMSGSGPSVFGLFYDYSQAEKAKDLLIQYGADAHICKPL